MFIAMNRIEVRDNYIERFEELFRTRAREVDQEPGLLQVRILKPVKKELPYIVMSYWEKEENFNQWVESGAFHKGHSRAFADMKKAREEGRPMPMKSSMEGYLILAD